MIFLSNMTSTIIEAIHYGKQTLIFFNPKLVNLSPLKNIYEQNLITNKNQLIKEFNNIKLNNKKNTISNIFYLNDDLRFWKEYLNIK